MKQIEKLSIYISIGTYLASDNFDITVPSKGKETLVDIGPFLEPLTSIPNTSTGSSWLLTAGQIHQVLRKLGGGEYSAN